MAWEFGSFGDCTNVNLPGEDNNDTSSDELITAIAVHDLYFYDHGSTYWTSVTGGNNDLRLAKAGAGQWLEHGGEKTPVFIFEQDKLQGFSSD